MSRKKARESAFMLLYRWDMMDCDSDGNAMTLDETILDNEILSRADLNDDDNKYIDAVLDGVREHQADIDTTIEEAAVGWKVTRIPRVDRAILRLGVYEIDCREDIPGAVTINECVELAKQYSTDHSGTFLNGVLSTILKQHGTAPCPSSD